MRLTVIISSAMLLLQGCHSKQISEILKAVPEKSYTKMATTDYLRIEVRLVPKMVQVLGAAQLNQDRLLTAALVDSLNKENGRKYGMLFIMDITPIPETKAQNSSNDLIYSSIGGYQDYREALEAFQSGLNETVWLESGGKKISLVSNQMSNNFGMSPGRQFTMVFPEIFRYSDKDEIEFYLVLDNLVPGLSRKKLEWKISKRKYESTI